MLKKNENISYLLFTFFLIIANCYIFKNYRDGWIYADLRNYQELYQSNDKPYINDIQRTTVDSVIKLSIAPFQETVLITLNYGIKDYSFRLNNSNKKITIDLTSLLAYTSKGNNDHTSSTVNIFESELPIARTLPYNAQDWTTPLSYFSDTDVQHVQEILDKEVKIIKNEHSIKKIKKIALFLTEKLEKGKGTQSSNGNPYLQYCLAITGKYKIWCTGYADIYHLFATIAGIPTRKVGFSNKINRVFLAGHSTSESYINESNEWVFIDLITSVIMPFSVEDNHFVNAAELHNLFKYNSVCHLKIHTYQQGKLDTMLLDSAKIKIQLKQFLSRDANINYQLPVTDANYYTLLGKVKRYLGLINVRVSYVDATFQKDNWKHFIKIALILLNIICVVLMLRKLTIKSKI
jgi:hypothetical protein